ncbi:TetR/AcrR family transcriptional regulator [Nocardia sp. NPDC059228]|uniref:TetR/AcrR family transcriptional regulator n=1 Tax=Nocardia sp. NPDC059228 TaxID=3346777 RepID=UPI0036B8CE7A
MPAATTTWQSGRAMNQPAPRIVRRPYGGTPAADRRAQRRAALLDAALDLLAAEGVTAVTVRKVCAAAKLNDRYFRESFADIDDLMGAVMEHHIALALTTLTEAAGQGDTPAEQTRLVVNNALDFLTEDPGRARLFIESQATGPCAPAASS